LRVYHFVNHQYGMDDLRRRRLKVATIADLNDPFELIGPSTKDPALRAAFRRVKEQLSVNRACCASAAVGAIPSNGATTPTDIAASV
jgi:hypothetical protein